MPLSLFHSSSRVNFGGRIQQSVLMKFKGKKKEREREMVSCGSAGKESACNVGDLDLIPGLGRSPGEGKGYPLQYSGLENSMKCIVHGTAKSDTTE